MMINKNPAVFGLAGFLFSAKLILPKPEFRYIINIYVQNRAEVFPIYERLIRAEERDFPEIYGIMLKAFPPSERRTEYGQLSLFGNEFYRVYLRRREGRIIGFLAVWEFPEISFIEHFAVDESMRGSGIGKEMLSEYLAGSVKPIFLEVEPPENEIAERRIGFYKRLGFCLNDFPYVQPALQEGQEPIPLKIMTYPQAVSEEDFLKDKKTAFRYVYNFEI